MRCATCLTPTRPGTDFGTDCGHRLRPVLGDDRSTHCPTCQAPTRVGVHFGTQCGHRLTPALSGDLISWRFHERRAARAAAAARRAR